MKTLKKDHWLYTKINPKNSAELFYKGSLKKISENSPKVAIIGSRKLTFYTQEVFPYLMTFLKKINATIISGGALGVDILAHKNALDYGLSNISFLASPLNNITPKENQLVLEQVSKNGILLSTQAPFITPKKYMFLDRNKMLVDLADIIIIPQAQLKSGTLKTGEYALTKNKPVFVLPARIFDVPFMGNLELIRKGAHVLGDFRDLLLHQPILHLYDKYLEKHVEPLRPRVKNSHKFNSIQIIDKLTDQIGL
jgi:DNA processing protein